MKDMIRIDSWYRFNGLRRESSCTMRIGRYYLDLRERSGDEVRRDEVDAGGYGI